MELLVLSSTPPKEMFSIKAPVPPVQVEEIKDTICWAATRLWRRRSSWRDKFPPRYQRSLPEHLLYGEEQVFGLQFFILTAKPHQ